MGTRLLLVSNYNSDTAVTLVRLGGVTDTVLGTVIPLMPLLLPSLFVLLLVARDWYVAALAGLCALLVATASPTFINFEDAHTRAIYEVKWFELGLTYLIGAHLPEWLSDLAVWTYKLLISSLPNRLNDWLKPESLVGHPRAYTFQELWDRGYLPAPDRKATAPLAPGPMQDTGRIRAGGQVLDDAPAFDWALGFVCRGPVWT
jgi:hypothetical protein